jgi:hypothetical protein
MTWLPVEVGDQAGRDGVLGLKPDPYDAIRAALTVLWQVADPDLVELARLRLAQLNQTRAELEPADPELLAPVESFEASPRFTPRQRAALAFAEQHRRDHRSLDGARARLAEHASRREIVNFTWALHFNDSYLRMLTLLDIAPDPPGFPRRADRTASAPRPRPPAERHGDDDLPAAELADPAFYPDLYTAINNATMRGSLVDEVTSEAIRLRNANRQGCLY